MIPIRAFRIPLSEGIRHMALAAFFFSLMALLVKMAGRSVPVFAIVLVRSLVTTVLSGWWLRQHRVPALGREPRLLFVRGVFGFLSLSCFYHAVVQLPLADATLLQYTNPVFTTLIAALVLREPLGLRGGVLTLLSLGGVVLVARPSLLFGGEAPLAADGVVAALAGAVFSASAYVTIRRLRDEVPMVVVFWFGALSSLLAVPPWLLDPRMPAGVEWLILIGVGIATHLGQVHLTKGLHREAAGPATAVGYLQILFAAGWGVLLFGERVHPTSLAGAAVILTCTFLIARTRAVTPTVAPGGGVGLPRGNR